MRFRPLLAVLLLTACGGAAGESSDPQFIDPAPPSDPPPPGPSPVVAPGVALCGFSAPASCTPKSFAAPVVAAVKRSGPGFRGTVLPFATPPEPLPPDDIARSVTVRIDRPLSGASGPPQLIASLAGHEVTLVFDAVPSFATGEEAYFFADVAVVGSGVIMQHTTAFAPSAYPTIETMVPDISQTLADRATYERMAAAELVAVGRVVSTSALPVDIRTASEHSPLWYEASVAPSCTIKGAVQVGATIPVRYASSDDEAWYASPKLTPGEEGAFILPSDQITGAPGSGYVVTQPIDVGPSASLSHLLDLLACPPPAL